MGTTFIHDRRERTNKQFKRLREMQRSREDDELRGHLKAACKMLKRRSPVDVLELTNAQQVNLLVDYVDALEDQAQDFLDTWPDEQGRRAARWFRMERAGALEQIVKLRIGIAKGDNR